MRKAHIHDIFYEVLFIENFINIKDDSKKVKFFFIDEIEGRYVFKIQIKSKSVVQVAWSFAILRWNATISPRRPRADIINITQISTFIYGDVIIWDTKKKKKCNCCFSVAACIAMLAICTM